MSEVKVDVAVTCKELTAKRKLKLGVNASATTEWIIDGTDMEDLALGALYPMVPNPLTWIIPTWATWTSYVIDIGVDQISDKKWRGIVNYGDPTANTKAQPAGFAQFDFEIGGGTKKVKYGISTNAERIYGTDAVTKNAAINVLEDGTIEGTDVPVPESRFSVTWIFNASHITQTYKRNVLYVANNPINNAAFWGKNAYEVLFLGATGRRRSYDKYEINFRFSYSPNQDGSDSNHPYAKILGLPGNPDITVYGHDVLWVLKEVGTGTDKFALPKPKAAYVNQVLYTSDFSLLGIGTTDSS